MPLITATVRWARCFGLFCNNDDIPRTVCSSAQCRAQTKRLGRCFTLLRYRLQVLICLMTGIHPNPARNEKRGVKGMGYEVGIIWGRFLQRLLHPWCASGALLTLPPSLSLTTRSRHTGARTRTHKKTHPCARVHTQHKHTCAGCTQWPLSWTELKSAGARLEGAGAGSGGAGAPLCLEHGGRPALRPAERLLCARERAPALPLLHGGDGEPGLLA